MSKTEIKNEAIPTPENTVRFDMAEARKRIQDPAVRAMIRAILNGEDGDDK